MKEKNILAVVLLYLFVGIRLPRCSFSFLADFLTFFWKGVNYCHKMLLLDVAGVLNPLQYIPTRIVSANNLIQVPDDEI